MQLTHLRGWLLVFVVYQSLISFVYLQSMLIWFIFSLEGLRRTIWRGRSPRRYWLVFQSLTLSLIISRIVLAYVSASGAEQSRESSIDSSPAMGRAVVEILLTVAWLLYWARSARVRSTYPLGK